MACVGRVWQSLEEVCEKYIGNSYLKMPETPPPPLRFVPVHDWEPTDICFELHLRCLLTKCVLEQTVASHCLKVMDGCRLARKE